MQRSASPCCRDKGQHHLTLAGHGVDSICWRPSDIRGSDGRQAKSESNRARNNPVFGPAKLRHSARA